MLRYLDAGSTQPEVVCEQSTTSHATLEGNKGLGEPLSKIGSPYVIAVTLPPAQSMRRGAHLRRRCQTINRRRSGKGVALVTAREDRRCLLHFFAWVKARQGTSELTFRVFASTRLGAVVEQFIAEKVLTCKHARVAKLVGSLLAAARFTHAMLKVKAAPGQMVSAAPVEEVVALLSQVNGEAVEETKFSVTRPPKAWLTWVECQQARQVAERAVAACKEGSDEMLSLMQSAALLVLFTAIPPVPTDHSLVGRRASPCSPFLPPSPSSRSLS